MVFWPVGSLGAAFRTCAATSHPVSSVRRRVRGKKREHDMSASAAAAVPLGRGVGGGALTPATRRLRRCCVQTNNATTTTTSASRYPRLPPLPHPALTCCTPHAHPLLPTAMAFVPYGFVLVQVQVHSAPTPHTVPRALGLM